MPQLEVLQPASGLEPCGQIKGAARGGTQGAGLPVRLMDSSSVHEQQTALPPAHTGHPMPRPEVPQPASGLEPCGRIKGAARAGTQGAGLPLHLMDSTSAHEPQTALPLAHSGHSLQLHLWKLPHLSQALSDGEEVRQFKIRKYLVTLDRHLECCTLLTKTP